MIADKDKIEISGIPIAVTFKDIKNLHLSVHPPTGRVKISAPRRMKLENIRVFAVSKLGWIKKHQKRMQGQQRETARDYVNLESHYFLGKRYLLQVIERARPKVILKHSAIELYVPKNSTKLQRQSVIEAWYRRQLKEIVPPYIAKWESKMNLCVNEFRIKKMRTKWGTCNAKAKRIWLNLELAKKQLHCIEYLVLHEMVHLLERRHNERFKALMTKYLPQWKQYRSELNTVSAEYGKWEY